MVVFTCNHCGESLRKPAVEKHYNFVCRTRKSLTCVDCFKDFREEEYVVHTKCITEEERYAAKGSMPNGVVKKGELKQESWVDMIKSILEDATLTPSQKNLLSTISSYSNIPRKKPKFLNFIKSSSGGRVNMKEVEDVWNIIESYKLKKQDSNKRKSVEENGDEPTKKKQHKEENEVDLNEHNVKTKKKKKKNEDIEESQTGNSEKDSAENSEQILEKFSFQEEITKILQRKASISLKKLQKKAVNLYLKHSGEAEVTPKIVKKFNKGLKKIPNVEIVDEYVSLKSN